MNKPTLHLAPMCNITNRATREIAKQHNCDVTWSEMISSEGLVRQPLKNNKSLALAKKFNKKESPYWVQIARKGGYGAVQINNIPQVVKIIKAIKNEISIPLSLKTRLGLTDPIEILEFAPKLEKAGIDQLVIHARTLKGLFSATPDWKIVKQLNNILSVPIIYNGGIKTPEDAKFYFEKTGCQNLMIGQAAIGNPWIFQEIKSYLRNEITSTSSSQEKKLILLKHARLVVKNYGSEKGLIGFRAQLSAYLRTLQAPKSMRKQATQITSISELKKLLNSL